VPEFPKLGNFSKQQGPHLQSTDTAGETVPPGFDPQRGTPRHQHPNRVYIDKMLELGRPIREVLNFVEEDERLLSIQRRLVESLPKDCFSKPPGELENRLGDAFQLRQFVKLDTEDAPGLDTIVKECLYGLIEKGGFPDLPRASQDRDRRGSLLEPEQNRFISPAAQFWKAKDALATPPRIVVANRGVESRRK
jgi:hypothetical protein